MNKKAQGMSLQTVIIAVLLLILLGFLIYILVSKGIVPFTKGLGQCNERGGQCKESCSSDEIRSFAGCYIEEGETSKEGSSTKETYKKEYICCIPVT